MNQLGHTEFPLAGAIYRRAIHILKGHSPDRWQADIDALRTDINALNESLYAQELEDFSDEFAHRLVHDGGWELRFFPDYMRDEDGTWHISPEDASALLENWPDPTRLPDGYPDQKFNDIDALEELLFQRRKNPPNGQPTGALCYALIALEKISMADALFHEGDKASRSKLLTETLLQASTAAIEAMEMVCTAERKLVQAKLPEDTAEHVRRLESEVLDSARLTMAKFGAKNRWEKSPKTAAKQQVKECWDIWQADPERYRSKKEFAFDMLSKYEALENPETILRWCRNWQADAASIVTTLPAQS